MKIEVNAMGDACPIPVVKTKNAIKELKEGGQVSVLVDNEIAVQNLTKMANQKQYKVTSEKTGENAYKVVMEVGAVLENAEDDKEEPVLCVPDARQKKTVVVVDSDRMGRGNDELGKVLMKGFLYALTQQETLPNSILFYNGGATLATQESDSLEDLKSMEAQGVEILTCGTCLNYYNLSDKLAVGGVTNMYAIVEIMTQADKIIKP